MGSSKIALATLLIPLVAVWAWLQHNHPHQPSAAKGPVVKVGERELKISGPYRHENVCVFLLHGKNEDERDYLTLFEGIEKKLIQVREKKQEQVSELRIDNNSEQYVFLHEGDRVSGGKQDRIIITSLVVPPNRKGVAIPSNCVESGRWSPRGGPDAAGLVFANNATPALAPKAIRAPAKTVPVSAGKQGVVWQNVAMTKQQALQSISVESTSTSLNEALDAPKVKEIIQQHSDALKDVVKYNSDAVGVAIAVNGRLEEVNVYPNNRLLRKIYPRLIQSYALDAAMTKGKGEQANLSMKEVVALIETPPPTSGEGCPRMEQANASNVLRVFSNGGRFQCATEFRGRAVHHQWLNGNGVAPQAAPQMGGRAFGGQAPANEGLFIRPRTNPTIRNGSVPNSDRNAPNDPVLPPPPPPGANPPPSGDN